MIAVQKKMNELWNKMVWMEEQVQANRKLFGDGDYLLGPEMTNADFVIFPTCFMDYLLPRNFGWNVIGDMDYFPSITAWYKHCAEKHPEFQSVKDGVHNFFGAKDEEGMF